MHSVVSLLGQAHAKDPKLTHFLRGDLLGMSGQANYLNRNGIKTGVNGGIPGVYSVEDFKRALELFWQNKFSSWWNYRSDFIEHKVCTEDEYVSAYKEWFGKW